MSERHMLRANALQRVRPKPYGLFVFIYQNLDLDIASKCMAGRPHNPQAVTMVPNKVHMHGRLNHNISETASANKASIVYRQETYGPVNRKSMYKFGISDHCILLDSRCCGKFENTLGIDIAPKSSKKGQIITNDFLLMGIYTPFL